MKLPVRNLLSVFAHKMVNDSVCRNFGLERVEMFSTTELEGWQRRLVTRTIRSSRTRKSPHADPQTRSGLVCDARKLPFSNVAHAKNGLLGALNSWKTIP